LAHSPAPEPQTRLSIAPKDINRKSGYTLNGTINKHLMERSSIYENATMITSDANRFISHYHTRGKLFHQAGKIDLEHIFVEEAMNKV